MTTGVLDLPPEAETAIPGGADWAIELQFPAGFSFGNPSGWTAQAAPYLGAATVSLTVDIDAVAETLTIRADPATTAALPRCGVWDLVQTEGAITHRWMGGAIRMDPIV